MNSFDIDEYLMEKIPLCVVRFNTCCGEGIYCKHSYSSIVNLKEIARCMNRDPSRKNLKSSFNI